uniref:protein-tyrosine-phosphatase n=1 Tax=Saccoglossus kowalevskii TaxID=10224 RepID=A0ABM0MYZ6_SACKO
MVTQITYKSTESVYLTTVVESKDILVEGSIDTHTLEELPAATQFEISVGVSDILEESEKSEPILTETTATIDLRKPKSNTDIKTDTQLMSYIVVVEEERQNRKRDLEDNQYITSSFQLNEIPDQLIVGDGMEYNGYINKPLTAGQQYVIYDGFAVYTTGVEELLLTDQPISSFQGGVGPGGSAVGVAVGVVVVLLVVVAIIVAVFIIRRIIPTQSLNNSFCFLDIRRLGNQKRSTEYETPNSSMSFKNAYANLEESSMNSAKPRSLPPKPKPKAKPIHNSQYTIQVKDLADYVIKKREENDFVSQFKLLPQSANTNIPNEAANIPENKSKNRFRNVLSYDHSRVVLDVINDDPNSDYINANYIDGYQKNNAYIATQGPTDVTIKDFWRMVLKENVGTILMTTNLSEGGKEQYEFIHTAVMEAILCGDTSISASDFRQIYGKLQIVDRKTKKSQLAGIGRTGSFISIDSMLKMANAEGCIDVFNFVKRGRENRMNFVQTA